MREAEGRSDLLLEKTQARLEDIQRGIDGLRLKRKDVETTIEATIQSLRNTLEFVREQETHERDDARAAPPAAPCRAVDGRQPAVGSRKRITTFRLRLFCSSVLQTPREDRP